MKNLKNFFIWFMILTVMVGTVGPIFINSTQAAGDILVAYGPMNGMTGVPVSAPMDFIFSTALDSSITENLSNYFSMSPSVPGASWQYFNEGWGDNTMYRVAYNTPEGLALNTTYTASVTISGLTVNLMSGPDFTPPALDQNGDTYSFTATTTNDPNAVGGSLAPMVFAGYPAMGMRDVSSALTAVTLNFDKFFNMDATTFTASNIYVKDILANSVISGVVSPSTGTSDTATVAVTLATNKQYRVYVTRDVKDVNGKPIMGMPDESNNPGPFFYDFYTGANTSAISSNYVGTNLNQFLSSGNIVNVPLGFVISASFDNPLLPSTVSSSTVTLYDATDSVSVNAAVSYNSNGNNIVIVPSTALINGHQYSLTITSEVQSITGAAVTQNIISFTTVATPDTVKPQLYQADADNYGFFLEFSEPMNQVKAVNKSYYTIKTRASDAVSWASSTPVSLNSANLRYNLENSSVMIDGLALTSGNEFQLTASTSITDVTGNALNDAGSVNVRTGMVMDSSLFGGGGGMFSGAGDIDMDNMGMMPINVMPMSNMAGLTTKYFVSIPITSQIPVNGLIELIFPTGFNVSGAIQDAYSPNNSDFNGPGAGTVTFASTDPGGINAGGSADDGIGVIGDKTVVIKLSAATQANDFLMLDLDGIINSSVPKGYETDGYQVQIRTKNSTGALLEAFNSMPFFITGGGSSSFNLTLGGVTSTDGGTISVFLDSPTTGLMKKTAVFNGAGDTSAVVNFTNIPNGQYMFFTEPSVTLGSTSYSGLSMPEPITVSGATNKSINLTKEIAEVGKATITVSITGALGADDIDVFAGSPTSFKVKTLTNPGTDPSVQLFLPDGDWMVGMSPAMPKDPMSGPPPMPNWMPPMPTKVSVSAGGTVIKETSGTSDDGTVSINLTGQSVNTVAGTVTDDGGNGIANADVYAYQPNGAFGGSNTKTANDGTFILKVPVKGVYTVGALKSGLPNGSEQAVNVQGNITGLTITMKKPAYTISGKVLNSSGSGVAYAPVWAYKPSGNGRADTMTDASGSYILYIDAGTWKIETDAPGTGWMEYGTNLTISSASLSGINIKPNSSTTYYSISGSVNIQGVAQAYMPIRAVAYDVNGNNLGKSYDAVTDSAGAYTISAPAGKYRVDIWTPEFGEVQRNDADDYANHPANVNLESGNKSGVNISIAGASLKTITIKVTNGTSAYEGFVNIEGIDANGSPTNFHRSLYISDLSQSKAISLEDGKNYLFFLNVPGLGSFIPVTGTDAADGGGGMSPTTGNIVVNGVNRDVIFSVPDTSNNSNYVTVSGAVTASGSNLKDAWVWVSNPATGFHNGTNTDSSGAYSLKLPVLSSGNYMIGADKPGYISIEPSQLNMVDDDNDGLADSNKNFVLSTYSSTISGHIYYDINSNQVKDSGENIPNGWVYAQEVATGIMSHAPVNGDGSYSLGVSNGSWQVFGAADGYLDTQYKENGVKTNITVSGSNVTGKNIALVVDANWNNRSKNKPMTPANGGVIDDTGTAGTGVKITVPANALGSSSASGSMSVSNTSSVAKTNSATPFGGKGKNIIASDNSGQPINNLNDYIDIEMVYWKSDIDAEVAANRLVDFNKLKAMQVGYFDASVNDWVTMSTARTAYYKTLASDVEWKTYSSGFSSFIDDALIGTAFTAFEDYKLVFKSSTNHLTVFGVTTPTDSTAPAAPNNLSKTSSNGSSIVLDWDNNSEADLLEYEIYRSSSTGVNKSSSQVNSSQVTASTFTDSTVSAFTSYFYTVTAVDDSGNESVVATELQVCSTSSVSNGSINSSCTITCDSGYNKSGNTCVAQSGGGGGGSMPTIYCSSVEFDVWQDSCIAGIQFRNVLKSSPAGCSLTSQQNLDRQKNCTSASDETIINETTEARPDGAGDAEKSAEAIVDSIKEIISEAQEIFKNNIESFVARFVGSRDVEKEQQYRNKYINKIVAGDSVSESVQNTMLNFVAYGTDTTKKLGAGERAGVVHSYKSALGKLPQSEVEWSDVVKIANGRWPSEINKDTEANAEAAFKKIYLRAPDRTNHHDDAAVVVMSYGLRPTNRNLDNEKAAIKSFRYIYKYDPVSASAWDIVRAIAYSGATR